MSYSVYLRGKLCVTCGRSAGEPDCPNPTYNLTPILDLALTGEGLPNPEVSEAEVVLFHKPTDRPRGLRVLNGKVARGTLADINRGIDRLSDEKLRAQLIALEPENKWGTVADALEVLRKYRDLAEEFPDNVWELH